ncbi:hypothetical protein [Bradyrhizobium zhanjiangense]|uniref:Uncharacterized protein n=1 Tax=Bradyrhizobium zhanjiangense TaxID=1325107 RepID=A0ABY0D9F7_9BRAD|nr:hypothetical protein [Bradyrhizobium zhanjiangense]RXG86755.1 hypothetical protein EAS62_36980 [Bradyrhizobium zhanjiangense]
MTTVIKFRPRQKSQDHLPQQRPLQVLNEVAALLAQVKTLEIGSPEELRETLFILDLANVYIRLFIGQIDSEGARKQLLAQSVRINQLIEESRS